jgi:CHAT domain-containing protein/tetratricopeptide (TPR) repeat protein
LSAGKYFIVKKFLALAIIIFLLARPAVATAWPGQQDYLAANDAFHREDFAQAQTYYQQALGKAEANSANAAAAVFGLAQCAYKTADYAKAEAFYEQCLEIQQATVGLDDPKYANTLACLAELYKDEGQLSQAESFANQARSIDEKCFGSEDLRLCKALIVLNEVYQHQRRYLESEQLCKRVLKIYESNPKADDLIAKSALNDLGLSYHSQHRDKDAEQAYRSALSICEKHPDQPLEMASPLSNLAIICKLQKRYAEAEQYSKQTLAIAAEKVGTDTPFYALRLNNLGGLEEAEGHLAEAEQYYKQALSIREKKLPPDHPELISNIRYLASLYDREGRYSEAESFYLRAKAAEQKSVDVFSNNNEFYRTAEVARYDVMPYLLTIDFGDQNINAAANSSATTDELIKSCGNIPITANGKNLCLSCLNSVMSTSDNSLRLSYLCEKVALSASKLYLRSPVMPAFEKALRIRRQLLPADDPRLAELEMQIGVAFQTMGGSGQNQINQAWPIWKKSANDLLGKIPATHGKVEVVSNTSTVNRPAAENSTQADANSIDKEFASLKKEEAQLEATRKNLLLRYNSWVLYCLGEMLAGEARNKDAAQAIQLSTSCWFRQSSCLAHSNVVFLSSISRFWRMLDQYKMARWAINLASGVARKSSLVEDRIWCSILLGELDYDQGDYAQAVKQASQAISLGNITFGDQKYCLTLPYELLASTQFALGHYSEVVEQTKKALMLNPITNSERSALLVVQGQALANMQRYQEAGDAISEAIESNEKFHANPASSSAAYAALAQLYLDQKQFKEAFEKFSRARLVDNEDTSINGLMDICRDETGLALSEHGLGELDKARENALHSAQLLDRYLTTVFMQLPFAQQCVLLNVTNSQRNVLLYCCDDQASFASAYNYLMHWRGLLVHAVKYEAAVDAAVEKNPAYRSLLEKRRQVVAQLAPIIVFESDNLSKEQAQSVSHTYQNLIEQEEGIEASLRTGNGNVSVTDPLQNVDASKFQQKLAPNEAFVDIYSYVPGGIGDQHYAAVVTAGGANGSAKEIDLGSKKEFDSAVKAWRLAVTPDAGQLQSAGSPQSYETASKALLGKFLEQPDMASCLSSATKIWICPDGDFATVPWQVIADSSPIKHGWTINEVDSPRELVALRSVSSDTSRPEFQALLAGVEKFADLPELQGALQEVNSIKQLGEERNMSLKPLLQDEVTKAHLISFMPKAEYVHLATHGFAKADIAEADSQSARGLQTMRSISSDDNSVESISTARNPLLECGLVLAGPQQPAAGAESAQGSTENDMQALAKQADTSQAAATAGSANDDSSDILTAKELVGLDLKHCNLITLSACQTGLGRELSGQGVIGLRSAIMGAGARCMLVSLWSVDDEATRELMKQFYSNLWDTQHPVSKSEALHKAQDYLRHQGQWQAPYFWAGWVLVGDDS